MPKLVSDYARQEAALTLQRIHNELYEIASLLEMDTDLATFAYKARNAQVLARDVGYQLCTTINRRCVSCGD
jgi:hypothetical protein